MGEKTLLWRNNTVCIAFAGLVKQTSYEFYLAYDWYMTLFFWDTLYAESLEAGVSLMGRVRTFLTYTRQCCIFEF